MTTPKTDPRPMTPAESRALDALVEWRRANLKAASHPSREPGRNAVWAAASEAYDALEDAADAVVAEREVQRG